MAVLSGLQAVHSQLSAAVQGSYKGQAVSIIPGANATTIQDSLEELTFTLSETISKKLADRTTHAKSFSARLHALMSKYVAALHEALSVDELKGYAEWLARLAKPSPQELQRRLEEMFGDDVESQVSTLEFLDELFTEQEHPVAKATIQQLKQQWKEDEVHGPLLRAGENVAAATEDFAGKIDSDIGLRNFYRTTVLNWSDLDGAYKSILERYAGESFSTATDFLLRALGCEIQSFGPSCDQALLMAVRDDIYYLQVVRRLHEQLEELAERIESTFGIVLCHSQTKRRRRKKSSDKSSHSPTNDESTRPSS